MAIDGSRSSFPESVDTGFVELFDLPFDKIQEAHRITELKGKASLTNDEQNEIKILNASLKEFMITPETFNKFQDALVAVQQFFYDNVQGFIEERQVLWNSYIQSFRFVGAWQINTQYNLQNMVTDSKGDLFICKRAHTSNSTTSPITNTTNWQQASAKGEKGDVGLTAIYKGDWLSTTSYQMGDAVCFGRVGALAGINYIALRANLAKSPLSNPSDWVLYQQVYAGTTRPTGAGAGLHFIQEV